MTRLAVVGGGPKALAALVELARAVEEQPVHEVIDVDVFEPFAPGAGAVWRQDTPKYLLMNVNASIVDMSSPAFPLSYRQWATNHSDPRSREIYPPRAIMGEYLSEAFAKGVTNARNLSVTHRALTVSQVDCGEDSQWTITANDSSQYGPYDVVLMATGHYEPVPPQWYRDLEVPSTASAETERVTVKGAALTGIDVVLALTVGRSGRFIAGENDEVRYVRSGLEPARIELVSRTGIPLAPKPQALTQECNNSIRRAMSPLTDVEGNEAFLPNQVWWEILVEAAVSVAPLFGVSLTQSEVRRALFQESEMTPGESVSQRLRAQLDMNAGTRKPDAQWIIGRVWNVGYQSIVESLERKPRDPAEWAIFRSVATRAERWAFGPPELTVRKLIALAEAGILSWRTPSDDQESYDVDAVTQPPGVKDCVGGAISDSLWQKLLVEGLCVVRPLERGVYTTPFGQCVNAHGQLTEGLYAIGRPTEDPVVGHDSLNYRLHGDIQRWARHILESLKE